MNLKELEKLFDQETPKARHMVRLQVPKLIAVAKAAKALLKNNPGIHLEVGDGFENEELEQALEDLESE